MSSGGSANPPPSLRRPHPTILGPRILTPSAVTHNHSDAGSGRSSRTAGVNVGGLDRRVELHRIAALLARPIARALAAAGGILRLYGRAKIHKSGPVYEEIWNRLIEAEKTGDTEKKGYAVLVTIARAEDLSGQPLT